MTARPTGQDEISKGPRPLRAGSGPFALRDHRAFHIPQMKAGPRQVQRQVTLLFRGAALALGVLQSSQSETATQRSLSLIRWPLTGGYDF
jgi:hypothetical protein